MPEQEPGRGSGESPSIQRTVAIVVLTVHAWWAGRAAQLRGRQLFFVTSAAAGLGLVMILLKDLVLIHLH